MSDFLNHLKSVPLAKTLRSAAISAMALFFAYVLQAFSVADADPIVVALLGPVVNWLRELAKPGDQRPESEDRSTPTKPKLPPLDGTTPGLKQ